MYFDAINLYIIPHLGYIKLKNLKENDVTSMLNELNNKPRQKEIVLLTMRQILDKAIDNNLIYKNIANKVAIKKYKATEKQPLTNLEISYLKQVAEKDDRCFAVLLMLYTRFKKRRDRSASV